MSNHQRPRHFLSSLVSVSLCIPFLVLSAQALAMKPPPRPGTPKPQAIETPEEEAKPSSLREVLDRRYRFKKKGQSEISIFGGNYLGDEWHNTWDAGAKYYIHINNTFAVGGSYTYSPIRADSETAFGQGLDAKQSHILDGEVMIANDCAFRAGGSIIECDLFLTIGMGAVQINGVWQPTGIIGGGIKIYTPVPWFAVRFDLNNYLHPTPKPSGDSFNSDMAINLGLSFLFPVRRIDVESQVSQ